MLRLAKALVGKQNLELAVHGMKTDKALQYFGRQAYKMHEADALYPECNCGTGYSPRCFTFAATSDCASFTCTP